MAFHAVPHKTGWAVRKSGSTRCAMIRLQRGEAWSEARRLARGARAAAYLFDKGGRIVASNSYS